MEKELKFELDLGRLALLKKNIWADYEQLFRPCNIATLNVVYFLSVIWHVIKQFNEQCLRKSSNRVSYY